MGNCRNKHSVASRACAGNCRISLASPLGLPRARGVSDLKAIYYFTCGHIILTAQMSLISKFSLIENMGCVMINNKSLKCLITFAAFTLSVPAMAEKLNNETVISLVELGLGDEAIVAKIKSSESDYNTDIDDLLKLKNQGVSSTVIAAMIDANSKSDAEIVLLPNSPDPNLPHPAGFYFLNDWSGDPAMERMDYTVSNQSKSGGLFAGGVIPAKIKVYLPGEQSKNLLPANNPIFYMFLDESNGENSLQISAWASGSNSAINSPSELTLIKLKAIKGKRESKVGKLQLNTFKTGVSDKDQIPFDIEEVRKGVFKLTLTDSLETGEYGFIFPINGNNNAGAATARIFDFSVVN